MNPNLLSYIRHLSETDTKTLTDKTLKATEELGDLAKVVLSYSGAFATNHRFYARERILEESVDTILCLLSVLYDQRFTDQEIADVMAEKTAKWATLQHKERAVAFPLPFEIHITVRADQETIPRFVDQCAVLSVKPIVLDLTVQDDTIVDVMTSSTHFGTNASAYEEAARIQKSLLDVGMDVVRVKIETVPWHPMAPAHEQAMPPGCYFECHVPVTLVKEQIPRLKELLRDQPVHLSRNVFKVLEGGLVVQMVTLRSYDQSYDYFSSAVTSLVTLIKSQFNVGRVITEFALYDTNTKHDHSWLTQTKE